MIAASISDYRELARRKLPLFLFEYLDGGSYAERTLRRNIDDLADVALRQRVLCDVSKIDLSTEWFGNQVAMPVALGPVGLAGMYARRGEVQAVRAAHKAGIRFSLSTVSTCSLKEVAAAATAPLWFQLYIMRDRAFMADLLDQAEAAGCEALIFTVDMPLPGARYRDIRSGLAGAPGLGGQWRRLMQAAAHPSWTWDVGVFGQPHTLGNTATVLKGRTGLEDFFAWIRDNFDASVTWRDLEWVRARWKKTLIIKGILDPEDAIAAAGMGADAIVVSNHGGRQLDGVVSTAKALPRVADRVGGRLMILADGGVRSGLDVVRMLALGAQGVLLGRAWVYALAGRGEAGVTHILELIEKEMRIAMALTGATRISEITKDRLDLT